MPVTQVLASGASPKRTEFAMLNNSQIARTGSTGRNRERIVLCWRLPFVNNASERAIAYVLVERLTSQFHSPPNTTLPLQGRRPGLYLAATTAPDCGCQPVAAGPITWGSHQESLNTSAWLEFPRLDASQLLNCVHSTEPARCSGSNPECHYMKATRHSHPQHPSCHIARKTVVQLLSL